jgi:hypothetical protein
MYVETSVRLGQFISIDKSIDQIFIIKRYFYIMYVAAKVWFE